MVTLGIFIVFFCALGLEYLPSASGKPINIACNTAENSSRLAKRMTGNTVKQAAKYGSRVSAHSLAQKSESAVKDVVNAVEDGIGKSGSEAEAATTEAAHNSAPKKSYWMLNTVLGDPKTEPKYFSGAKN
ncbi:hypothetical protein O181_009978 [Austropuccinia psidii MF-1]|uniref:Uncharacterized protein n=1 Tax=Austropuccinia psidii MF-1 TaxID=1389203 RepID=A0A9Q3BSF1_9BASI|nr:hypothetical protein [Austropuccinia psidii MF-1]